MVLGIKKTLTVAVIILLLHVSVDSVHAYTSNANFFSIEEPSGWTTNETTSGSVVVTFFEPTSDDEGLVLIQINVETTSSDMTLEDLVTAIKDQYPTMFNSSFIINESRMVINGVNAYEIVSAVSTGGYDLMINMVMMVKNLRIYIVTYAAVTARYQHFLSNFEDSIETFTIIDPIPWYFAYMFFGAIIIVLTIIAVGLHFYKKRANSLFIRS
jgi:hypothetical protein